MFELTVTYVGQGVDETRVDKHGDEYVCRGDWTEVFDGFHTKEEVYKKCVDIYKEEEDVWDKKIEKASHIKTFNKEKATYLYNELPYEISDFDKNKFTAELFDLKGKGRGEKIKFSIRHVY